jgi:predicted metalloprotease with PDZ domain
MIRTNLLLALIPMFTVVVISPRAPAQQWPLDQPFMPHRGRIGVQVQPMSPELREHLGAPPDRGILVNKVEPDRPAARADVRVGDVIVTADGVPIRELFDLTRVIARVPAGEALDLRVIRDKQEIAITVRPEGEATPWIDPEHWTDWLEKGLRQGNRALREKLERLERRLEELERKFEEQRKQPDGGRAT